MNPTRAERAPKRTGPIARVLRWIPAVVSVALLAAIAVWTDGFAVIAGARWDWIAAAIALSLALNVGLASFKLWVLLRWFGVPAGLGQVVRMILGLLAATFFMPFQTGHLLYAVALRRTGILDAVPAFECIAYDKYLTLLGTLVLLAGGVLLLPDDHVLARPEIAVLAAAGVATLWLGGPARRLAARFPWFAERSLVLAQPLGAGRKLALLGLATIYQASDVATMGFACLALGIDADPRVIAGATPAVILLSWIPVTVSGLGVRESLVALVFAGRIARDTALAAGLLIDLVEYAVPAIAGTVMLPALIRALHRGGSGGAPGTAPRP